MLQISDTVKPNKATSPLVTGWTQTHTHTPSISIWYLPLNRKRNREAPSSEKTFTIILGWWWLASSARVSQIRVSILQNRPTDRPPQGHYCRPKWSFNILLSHHFLSWSSVRGALAVPFGSSGVDDWLLVHMSNLLRGGNMYYRYSLVVSSFLAMTRIMIYSF